MSITEEVVSMSRRDGTGPMGRGAMSRRGFGVCAGSNAIGYGAGLGHRRGLGRNFAADPTVSKTQKELLQEQKELLESKLNSISKQLQSL